MLPGDVLFLLLACLLVGGVAVAFYREHRRGITGIRADISPRRAMVGMGCVLAAGLGFLVWGLLWIASSETFEGRSGLFTGVRMHQRTMAIFVLCLGAICFYLATRLCEHFRRGSVGPRADVGVGESTPAPASAWTRPSLVKARRAWIAKLEKGPDWGALERSVRDAVAAGWGVDAARCSIRDCARALEERQAHEAAALASGLLEDIEAARYGGGRFESDELSARFAALADLADQSRARA